MKKIVVTSLVLITTAMVVIIGYFYKPGNAVHNNQNVWFVGTNPQFPPFDYIENGKITGFEIDLMDAIGTYLGKEIVYKDMAFESLLLEAQAGRIQVIASGMTPTVERSTKVFFTKPYLAHDPLVVITLASESPKNLEDLQGKEVVVNDGFTAESYMKQQQGIDLKSLATPAEAFFALLNGRAYAYVSARSAAQPFFDRYGSNKFNILTLTVSDSYALAVPKAYPEVFKQIQKALNALESNGSLESLKKKWHLNF